MNTLDMQEPALVPSHEVVAPVEQSIPNGRVIFHCHVIVGYMQFLIESGNCKSIERIADAACKVLKQKDVIQNVGEIPDEVIEQVREKIMTLPIHQDGSFNETIEETGGMKHPVHVNGAHAFEAFEKIKQGPGRRSEKTVFG